MKEFIVDRGFDARQLPDLSVFENDFENPRVFAVSQGLDLGIEDWNVRNCQRRDEVLAVVDLAIAFATEDHEVEHTEQMFAMTIFMTSAVIPSPRLAFFGSSSRNCVWFGTSPATAASCRQDVSKRMKEVSASRIRLA